MSEMEIKVRLLACLLSLHIFGGWVYSTVMIENKFEDAEGRWRVWMCWPYYLLKGLIKRY